MEEINELVNVMKTLRSENGCSWDKKQTHESLVPYVLEEAYEVVDALEKKDFQNLKEELGDLLFQIVFHSELASEVGRFTLEDVVRDVKEKLIRRHPHVFGEQKNLSPEEVESNWEKLKSKEKLRQSGILDSIPKSLPALQRAEKLQDKAKTIGFDWDSIDGPISKFQEEWKELEEARLNLESKERLEEELGDVFFSLVNISRFLKISPETAIRKTCNKFSERFSRMEMISTETGIKLDTLSLKELDALWDKAKKIEKGF
ncbi:MAG: nucleoside triphosphate pyrophosphohydrolase [Leptospiraceae bacterium]|nr:nucleoside triphosphate pyrophosphohydrolase [Leptospiraceae bacterium]